MKLEIMDEFIPIPDGVAVATSKDLAKTQGILTGISGGATMWAAIETAKKAPASAAPPLIVLVSSFGGKAYTFNVGYGVGKAAIDRLALDMSVQLRKHGVATAALYPGRGAPLSAGLDGPST